MEPMHEQIRQTIAAAAAEGHKLATFHYEVLAHSAELESADADGFCRAVDVPASYVTEFRKMIALAKLIRERGLSLS